MREKTFPGRKQTPAIIF